MKRNIFLMAIVPLLSIALSGCFKDKGEYDYEKLNEPIWSSDRFTNNINVYCRSGEGSMALFNAEGVFTWGKNHDEIAKEYRYEWTVGDKVIGDKVKFEMSTDDLMKMLGLTKVPNDAIFGHFAIINKSSGVKYLSKVYIKINPRFGPYDWFVLSEDGGDTKLSVIQLGRNSDGTYHYNYLESEYKRVNGRQIKGRPLGMYIAEARDVSAQGSVTVITDKSSEVLNGATIEVERTLSEAFPDGVPQDFVPVARRDQESTDVVGTFVATADGRLFTRIKLKNYLVGTFLSDPYFIDEKGYEVTWFGHSLMSENPFPMWDKKNRRVLLGFTERQEYVWNPEEPQDKKQIYRSRVVAPKPRFMEMYPGTGPKFWDMPEGTEVFCMTQDNVVSTGGPRYSMLFNNAEGKSLLYTYKADPGGNLQFSYVETALCHVFQNVHFDENTVFLPSASFYKMGRTMHPKLLLYSDGNKIKYLYRDYNPFFGAQPPVEGEFPYEFDARVTAMCWDNGGYDELLVGCENGDVIRFSTPYTFHEFGRWTKADAERRIVHKVNVGGRVVALKMYTDSRMRSNNDNY